MTDNKVLLIGNDINNATSDYSWFNLLADLIDYAKLTDIPSSENKPFPLFYEEIFLSSAKRYGTKESRLKTYIGAKARRLRHNEIHKQIIDLKIKTILTTNYDFTLEKVLTDNTDSIKNSGYIKESLYSLFRLNKINDYNFWHIHGYEIAPQTITLGYEHYSGYLQQMRNYVVTGTKGTYKKKDFAPLSRRIKESVVKHESWIDYFFTHDIYIFGLNFDFVEMHLWWLLTYRARATAQKKLEITNNIYYFYPKKYEKQSKHKLDLFKVNDVITIPITLNGNNRIAYYKNIINWIKKDNKAIAPK